MSDPDALYAAATSYVIMGWHLFVVRENKIPFPNCSACPVSGAGCAGRRCDCTLCHGHLAATSDMDKIVKMIAAARGKCCLAVSCGPSGLVVVDAEGDDRVGYGRTGLEILDELEEWTGGKGLPHRGQTLRARTSGGGVHLFYRGQTGSTNRLFPNVDIKSAGGYVVLPPAAGRRWERQVPVRDWDQGFLSGVKHRYTSTNTRTAGVSVLRTVGDGGVPDGMRYEYTRDMIFLLRKQDTPWDTAVQIMREAWTRYAQPPRARYALPWERVRYEMERAWARVEPDEAPHPVIMQWASDVTRKEGSA